MPHFHLLLQSAIAAGQRLQSNILGAIAFYTSIPIPHNWSLDFTGIARWAPGIGLLIGLGLGGVDAGFGLMGLPILVRSALLVASWVAITGGLHLDGAMDTADGLAVLDPQRRLEVMADSRTGAFGVMAALLILLLKLTALASLERDRGVAVMLAAGWGRWGQLAAIAFYPYLKPTGKGAFHKAAIRSPWEVTPTLILLVGITIGLGQGVGLTGWTIGWIAVDSCLMALLTGAWLQRQLGGQTGDTYGAIVEWTEALLLCGLTIALR